MYERLLDKNNEPNSDEVKAYTGSKCYERLLALEEHLERYYQLSKEMRFPFGKKYGWGYKYNHKSTHLCYVFFEKGAFTVTIQIGDKHVHFIEEMINDLSSKAQKLWMNRYPCGEHGGWIHYRVLNDDELSDIYMLIGAKKKPTNGVNTLLSGE